MSFEMRPIPDGMDVKDWSFELNGQEVRATHFRLSHPVIGTVEFGLRPEGFLGWVFQTTGSVTLPYAIAANGRLLIGLLPERRANLGEGESLNIIGGYVDPGETNTQTQRREAEEEAGLGNFEGREARGVPVSNQRSHNVADWLKDEGCVHIYYIRVPLDRVFAANDGTYRIAPLPSDDPERMKKIFSTVLMPFRQAVEATPDPLAGTAIARLVAELYGDVL